MKRTVILLYLFLLSTGGFSQSNTPHLQYIHPKPGSRQVNPESSLIFGFDKPLSAADIASFTVRVESARKKYQLEYTLSEKNKTLILRPSQAFTDGETVKVSLESDRLGLKVRSFSFGVTKNTWNPVIRDFAADFPERSKDKTLPSPPDKIEGEPAFINDVVVPADFPAIDYTLYGETAPGYLFLSNFFGPPYILILKNDGTPWFYRKVEDTSIDFKVQPTGVLTRRIIDDVYGFVSMDSNYNTLDTFLCDNGYFVDQHDIQLLENGHALLIASESRTMDMSALVPGGNPEAEVIGEHIQEIDENGNSVFEFLSWDNFEILAATGVDFTASEIDYVHANSVAVDFDGNLLMSSRNLSECTKINRQTGEIMWRLGGKYNQFNYINEVDSINYQHDFRPVPGVPGNYTIFDNGNERGFSRVVEYQIDTMAMTATKVWEYRPEPDILDNSMGNAQRLPNGNTMINWAAAELPKANEVTQAGELLYEANFVSPTPGYRTFRFEWDGYATKPYLILESYSSEVRLMYNLFNQDSIVEYRIYGGTTSEPTELMATTAERWIDLSDFENSEVYYFRVTAVNSDGFESDYSNEESAYIRQPEEGVNIVRNGDFSEGQKYWNLYLYGGAAETYVNDDTALVFDISNGGTMEVGVQFLQDEIPLYQGIHYRFEFDAFADQDRSIVAKVVMDNYPYTNYSGLGTVNLTTTPTHYSYNFQMASPDDFDCRVVFNCGMSTANVTIDNVSLEIYEPEAVRDTEDLGSEVYVFPNPVDEMLNLSLTREIAGDVRVTIYTADGRQLRRYIFAADTSVGRTRSINLSDLSEGIYFCQMNYYSVVDRTEKTLVKKILKN